MLRLELVAVGIGVAGCGAGPSHTAIGRAALANAGRLLPLPSECAQRPYDDGPPWHKMPGFPCDGVQRAPDGGWVTVKGHVVFDRRGAIVSRTKDEAIHRWPEFIELVGERGGRLP